MSCASTTLCVTGDGNGDVITLTDPLDGAGAVWTSKQIGNSSTTMQGLACTSAPLCLIRSGSTAMVTGDPQDGANATWAQISILTNSSPRFACVPSAFCIAVRGGAVSASNDPQDLGSSTWGTNYKVDYANFLSSVSCFSTSFCAGTDQEGNIVTSTNPAAGASATWTGQQVVSPSDQLNSISCPSATLCVAVTRRATP